MLTEDTMKVTEVEVDNTHRTVCDKAKDDNSQMYIASMLWNVYFLLWRTLWVIETSASLCGDGDNLLICLIASFAY